MSLAQWRRGRENPVLSKWQALYFKPSKAEVVLEPFVARLGVRYRFQHLIWHYVIDFALPDSKIAIELDGPDHNRPERKIKDAERTAWLQKHGWRVVRIKNKDVFSDPVGSLNGAMESLGEPFRVQPNPYCVN